MQCLFLIFVLSAMDLKFKLFENKKLIFNHPEFDNNWSINMSVLFDCENLIHYIIPKIDHVKLNDKLILICNIHLINVFIGDINQLKVIAFDKNIILKSNLMSLFTEISNTFLIDVEYDGIF